MKLREVLNMVPLPVSWVTANTASFELDADVYGIIVECDAFNLPDRSIKICSIGFGTLKDKNGEIVDSNLSTELTNKGKARTIFSTIAKACEKSAIVLNSDTLILAGDGQKKEQRANIYLIGVSELSNFVKVFKHTYRFKLESGAQVVAVSKIEFTTEEQSYITAALQLNKI